MSTAVRLFSNVVAWLGVVATLLFIAAVGVRVNERWRGIGTYTVEPRLVEMYEHENAYLIWVSDPVSRLYILGKGGESTTATTMTIRGGNTTVWHDGTFRALPMERSIPTAYTLEDPFLFDGSIKWPTITACRPYMKPATKGIAKLLYINSPRFDWVGCAVPSVMIAGTDYKETKPWEVSYVKREGWPDSPRVVIGEKESKVKWWVQDGTWGRGVQ